MDSLFIGRNRLTLRKFCFVKSTDYAYLFFVDGKLLVFVSTLKYLDLHSVFMISSFKIIFDNRILCGILTNCSVSVVGVSEYFIQKKLNVARSGLKNVTRNPSHTRVVSINRHIYQMSVTPKVT